MKLIALFIKINYINYGKTFLRSNTAVTSIACSGRDHGLLKMLKVFIITLLIGFGACQVKRPCALSDLKCIGRNLAANSRCNPNVVGRIPSRYTVNSLPFDAPFFNATYIDYNLVVSNHNKCRVSEFFINLTSKVAVLALDCPDLDFASNRLTIQHSSLKEDRQFSYNIQGTYPLIRLTTNLRASSGLNLCSSFTFADVAALPRFRVNPNNQKTANFLSRDLTLVNIFERECFFWRAPLLARYFINSLICDYGCDY